MRLAGKKVIALVDDEFEDLELWYPVYRVREEGAEVHLAGLEKIRRTSVNMAYLLKQNTPGTSLMPQIMMGFWFQAAGLLIKFVDTVPF